MGKLIFIALVVVLAVWLLRRALRSPRAGAPREEQGAQELVRCAHCGIHLPRADALLADAQPYCSQAHARLGARQS